GRHPGRVFGGKNPPAGQHRVNLGPLEKVVGAHNRMLPAPQGGPIVNICAPAPPARNVFFTPMTRLLGKAPPHFRVAPDNGKG
ncbi:SDR family NAD(P)-dependent oxidoreductase, partial [Salmonella enterica subsp. enterica serovar Oslo]|nr:SDR family NAD(P)-dependent oxidoreductase [Salmonella enterica subsp. enterica serovar Oslo]